MAAPAKKLSPEEEHSMATDFAVKIRRGQLKMKDVPENLRGKVAGVSERDIMRRAVEQSTVKRYSHLNRAPAARR
jgi:hypothetical protein